MRQRIKRLLSLIRYPVVFNDYYVIFQGQLFSAPSLRQRKILVRTLQGRGMQSTKYFTIIYRLIQASGRYNPTILDIGGNIGYVALEYNRLLERLGQGSCISFEPCSENCRHFLNNTKLANRVFLFSLGLGQSSRFIKFGLPEYVHRIGKDTTNTGFYSSKNILADTGTPSAVYQLDEISQIFDIDHNPISFVKIDVEGSELDVIIGAKNTLAAHKPCLEVEFNRYTISEEDYRQIFLILTELGYRSFAVEPFDELSSVEHFIELYFVHESEANQISAAETLMHSVDCL